MLDLLFMAFHGRRLAKPLVAQVLDPDGAPTDATRSFVKRLGVAQVFTLSTVCSSFDTLQSYGPTWITRFLQMH